jgi:signal transduction histidine kinase
MFRTASDRESAGLHLTLLVVGTALFGLLIVGVVMYMVLTIKAVRLGRRQSNFIDSVTHELKSPIASMKLYLQTLRRRAVAEDRRESFYELMLEDVDRLDHLINQMLDAGRLESGRTEGEMEVLALADVLRECAEITQYRHRVARGTIRLDLEPCSVRGRRSDLVLVFRNLLDNAVKYAGDPPLVRVRAGARADGRLLVIVEDNGRGVPAGMRRRIFGRFVRLGSELERDRPGTGLGLYVAKAILQRIGGRIRARDRPGGPGTRFEVVLPSVPTEGRSGAPGDRIPEVTP